MTFMQNAVDQNPDAVWKVVVFHHSIYSAAGHIMDDTSINRRNQLVPMLQELDIDVVLVGHDHVYVRTYMMVKPILTSAAGCVIHGKALQYF